MPPCGSAPSSPKASRSPSTSASRRAPTPPSTCMSHSPRASSSSARNELRDVPSFVPARDAVDAAGIAAPFLESVGETVPADPRERASRMLVVFLAALWEGSTEFSLDRERLEAALVALDAEARDADEADVLIVPVVGLRMSRASLQLPHGVRLIRADAIEAPIEAMRSDGMGRSAWEPQYLAVAEQDESPESAESAMRQLRELISVMRLFKAGGIGLGPYAFAPTGGGHWGRIPTGARGNPRRRLPAQRRGMRPADRVRDHARGPARPRRRPLLGRRPLRDGLRSRERARGTQRPPPFTAGSARRTRPGRRLAADACLGADRRRELRPDRSPRQGRERARARALADERRPARGRPQARRLDRGGRPPHAARRRPRRAR